MAMLAERKTKQKWSLNPRGKDWSEDSNKFGQKMLEKMGWSKGKGLGARENGIVEHVKISYKNDSKGMGYKETNDQWTEHDANFNAFLSSLTGSGDEANVKLEIKSSLEEKSQNSRKRVHYKKFTRGKDLSRCSAKDLANIFGRKSLDLPKIGQETEKVAESEVRNDSGFLVNGGSMLDYFKKKMPSNYGNNKVGAVVVGSNGVLKKLNDDENKKRKFDDENEEETGKKRKKRKIQDGCANPAFDPLYSQEIPVEKHFLNAIEEETNESNDISQQETNEECLATEKQMCDFEVKRKSKKKKKQKIEEVVQKENEQYETIEKVSKKKKKSAENGITNENFNDSLEETSNNNQLEVPRRKKKSKAVAEGITNENFDNSLPSPTTNNNNFEVKRKKKKKVDYAIDNPTFEETAENQEDAKPVESANEIQCDLMLNVTATPVAPIISARNSKSKRKSVRFSAVNDERLIPTNEEMQRERNELFDINTKVIENGLRELKQRLDGVEAEIDNDLNEAKTIEMIGEVGADQSGENEQTANGASRLKFKYAKFHRGADWMDKGKQVTNARTSYKHLIKGDIIVGFNNSNLYEIKGYPATKE